MDESLYDSMYELEQDHWWFVARRRIVLHLLERFGPPPQTNPRACDVGCGCGMMLTELTRAGYDAVGLDASPVARAYCKTRGHEVKPGRLPDGVDLPREDYDVVLALDVLEHVEQDHASMRWLWQSVAPGGILVCTVPAWRCLWAERDRQHHHLRRYDRSDFSRLVAQCRGGVRCVDSYMLSLLFPVAALSRLAARLRFGRGGMADLSVPPEPANTMLKGLFEGEKHILAGGGSLPCGLSLIAVVRKPGPCPG